MAWLAIVIGLLDSKMLMTMNSWNVITCQTGGMIGHILGLYANSKILVEQMFSGITSLQLKASS